MANNSSKAAGSRMPRPRLNASNAKTSHCNFFTARANPQQVVLSFGLETRGGSEQKGERQVQIHHKVVLDATTARRVKDAMVTLFQKVDTPRIRVTTQPARAKKPN